MRRPAPLVFLAVLAACTVTTTGAPCTSDLNCPSDQGCGSDRVCSVAALSCPGHDTDGECTPGTTCVAGQVATCTPSSGVCATLRLSPCTDPGASCSASGGEAACACPTTNACTQPDATQCNPAGDAVRRCLPVVAGSACLVWQVETSCAGSGLVCSASACVCPTNTASTYFADPVNGSSGAAPPRATGVASPPACRFSTLTEALAAAAARGPGSSVVASGWSAAAPAGVVLFSEPGALAIGAGVALTTDDPAPTTSHYAISTPAALTVPLVTIGPGGAMTGFELRNGASTGDGVRTSCAGTGDTSPVTLATIRVSGAGDGTPAPRLASGIHVTGACPVTASAVAVDGSVGGVLVEGNLAVSGSTIGPNAGDGIFVTQGSLVADGCTFQSNGTHVHARPTVGSTVSVTVRNSPSMTGAADSAFRLLALGTGSALVLENNVVSGNTAAQSYNLVGGTRRGGGVVITAPFPATLTVRGNQVFGNRYDQFLVAAGSPDVLGAVGGTASCGTEANTFACLDTANGGVGMYSGGATVDASWNHWTRHPGVFSVDVGGVGIGGYDTNSCLVATVTCP